MSTSKEFERFRKKYFPIKHQVSKSYYQDQLNCVKKFLQWVDSNQLAQSISAIKTSHVAGYISELNRKELSSSRISFVKKSLNTFFKHAGLNIHLKTTPKGNQRKTIPTKAILLFISRLDEHFDYNDVYLISEILKESIRDIDEGVTL